MPVTVVLNGQPRTFAASQHPTLMQLLKELDLQADRIALEVNGQIVPRARWPETTLANGDRLEMVHFVGGGSHP